MQYPLIQFYRGSLVRLASGKLKQVEDLSSEDFLESARIIQHSQASNNNTHSLFNSPEPTSSSSHNNSPSNMIEQQDSLTMMMMDHQDEDDDDDEDEELDVVSDEPLASQQQQQVSANKRHRQTQQQQQDEDLYIDSSVVKDFLEVANIPGRLGFSSPESSNSSSSFSVNSSQTPLPSTSSNNSPRQQQQQVSQPNTSVLIKFFLESSRSIVFIEVPVEHPFFVFHRGWSSWNPQRTYDKFGLKCRKLKIGDTCISLIRRQRIEKCQQQDSDQCNILLSAIKIN